MAYQSVQLPKVLILVQYCIKFMHGIVKFLIVGVRSLLLNFCTVLLSEVSTIQCHVYWTTLKV